MTQPTPRPALRLQIALQLAAKGFRIFPLLPNSKKPVFNRWPQRATTNPDTIRVWWEQNPQYNIGIACGRADDATDDVLYLVVVDYDMKEGQAGAETLAKHQTLGFLETYQVKTPNGVHAYFWGRHRLRNSVSRIALHVDVRCWHGYVVGPGSTVDGKIYTHIEDSPALPASLPQPLNDMASQVTETIGHETVDLPSELLDSPRAIERVKMYLINDAPDSIQGNRGDNTTFEVARRCRALGVSFAVCLELMLDFYNEDKCYPAWSVEEMEAKVRNAYKYVDRSLGIGNANPDIEFKGELELLRTQRANANKDDGDNKGDEPKPMTSPPKFKTTFNFIDYRIWDDVPLPEIPQAYPGAPLNEVGILGGEGGDGKTTIELMRNTCHALGIPWFGLPVMRRPTLYLGAEDILVAMQRRIMLIARYYKVKPSEIYAGGMHLLSAADFKQPPVLARPHPQSGVLERTRLFEALLEWCGDNKPVNISLDPLSHVFAGNEVDRVQVYAFIHMLRELARAANGTVTLLGHPSVRGIETGTGISGSTAWHAAVRFRAFLRKRKRKRNPDEEEPLERDNGWRMLEFHKNQYGALSRTIELRWHAGVFRPIAEEDRAAREEVLVELFLELLSRFTRENRNVSLNSRSPNYAPAMFVQEEEAKGDQVTKEDLERVMRDLLRSGRIANERYLGVGRRWFERLVVLGEEKRGGILD